MSSYIETIFIGRDVLSGRELHCQMDRDNRVSWQEVPTGEQGISIPFGTPEQAKTFMGSTARILGYSERLVRMQILDLEIEK